jgi:hypothetical protein
MSELARTLDCACVIHGNTYDWMYVDRLYNMLTRHLTAQIRLHVYTEADRAVPEHMIKHSLDDWGIGGPRASWWYKIQMFDATRHAGPLLYFDLDTVIVDNIDWITTLPGKFFWTLQDFKYLWRQNFQGINSSIMWWDTQSFDHVYRNFKSKNIQYIMKHYQGDQDYLTREIDNKLVRFLNPDRIKSWRWQCLNGGYDFKRRIYLAPDTGTQVPTQTSVLIFHGKPKPSDIQDPVILQHWK